MSAWLIRYSYNVYYARNIKFNGSVIVGETSMVRCKRAPASPYLTLPPIIIVNVVKIRHITFHI